MNVKRSGLGRAVVIMLTALSVAAPASANASADTALLCVDAVDPASCAESERQLWQQAADYAATLPPNQLASFCGSPACSLEQQTGTALADDNITGVSCVLRALWTAPSAGPAGGARPCDLFPALQEILDGGAVQRLEAALVDHYTRLGEVVRDALSSDVPTYDELMLVIAFLSGTPETPPAVEPLYPLVGSNVSAGTAGAAYESSETHEVPLAGIAVPAGCTAVIEFATPDFRKHKPLFQFYVNFRYGQLLQKFAIVDKRYGPGLEPCPPTRADIDMHLEASFEPTPLSAKKPMRGATGLVQVTASWDTPYVNCRDANRCTVLGLRGFDVHPAIECCQLVPYAHAYFWHVGAYDLMLWHDWTFSHGYDPSIFGAPNDGYVGRTYNQTCRWVSGGDFSLPETCSGDG